MTSKPNPKTSKTTPETPAKKMPSPLDCLGGSGISAAIAVGAGALTYKIAQTFAAHPTTSTNRLTHSIGGAVRTLVVGVGTLGTFVFSFVALGLLALMVQLWVQGNRGDRPTDA